MNWYLKVLKHYADFRGRAQRAEFWYFFLFNMIFTILLLVIDTMIGTFNPETGNGLLSGIYSLAIFIPYFAVSVRRLHDIGKSGWWLLIGLIPLIGLIILIIWFAKDSEEGSNQYGRNPKEDNLD